MKSEFDIVVLGGGTGGYVAAIRAAQVGLSVAIVENKKLGGTCLHEGCIPSKALLKSAKLYRETQDLADFGIEVENIHFNWEQAQSRKQDVVENLYKGVQYLMDKGKIAVFNGYGRILGPSIFSPMPGTISIEHGAGEENTMLIPTNVIIATGSSPRALPGIGYSERVISSTEILNLEALPDSVVIVGAGAIGLEWASMLSDLGVQVTVVEGSDQVLPNQDRDIAAELQKTLVSRGVKFNLNQTIDVETIVESTESVTLKLTDETEEITTDYILVSIGRVPNSTNIGLENTKIEVENEAIVTNEFFQTKEKHIYAIGDCIGGMQLAHVASSEGIKAVEHIANLNPDPLEYENIPSCVYTNPEVSTVGLTEKSATEKGLKVETGTFPFSANGKALADGTPQGFIKVVRDKVTDDLLGVHIIGPDATNLIGEAGLAKMLDASAWEMTQVVHAHPTLSEVLGEATLAINDLQING